MAQFLGAGGRARRESGPSAFVLTPLIGIGLALSGCATIPERVPFKEAPSTCKGSACNLAIARQYASDTEADMITRLKKQRDDRDFLRTATFLGALATAGATSFGGGRDLTVALGLGTGTLAITSSLTVDRGYGATYLAAADASACIASATQTVETSAATLQGYLPVIDGAEAQLGMLGKMADVDAERKAVALVTAQIVRSRIGEFDIAGSAFAANSISAVNDVVVKARQQIVAEEPDREAFGNAITAIGSLAVAPDTKTVPPTPATALSNPGGGAGARAEAAPAAAVTSPSDQARLTFAEGVIERARAAVDAAISQALTGSPAKLTTCSGFQAVAAAQPLVVSGAPNDSVEISKDTNVSLTLSGGDVGYRGAWVGLVPKDITLSQQGNTIDIGAGSSLAAGKTYKLRIHDLANKSQSKDISVATK